MEKERFPIDRAAAQHAANLVETDTIRIMKAIIVMARIVCVTPPAFSGCLILPGVTLPLEMDAFVPIFCAKDRDE